MIDRVVPPPPRCRFAAVLAVLLGAIACQPATDPGTDPEPFDTSPPGEPSNIVDTVAVTTLAADLDARAVRVAVAMSGDPLVASQVEIASFDDVDDPEMVRGFVHGHGLDGAAGHLTLTVGALRIDYDDATVFRSAAGDEMTVDEFRMEVQAALDADGSPPIRAERSPADRPQAPDDATFVAELLALEGGLETTTVELNVDHTHVERNPTPPPDGWIHVLGLDVELRVSEGITTIRLERRDIDARRFAGLVTAVDVAERTVTLEDGTVVLLTDDTRFTPFGIGRWWLNSLEAVARAVEDGIPIRAVGRGAVESESPLTLVAIRIAFRPHRLALTSFHGTVESVRLDADEVVLADGTVLRFHRHSVVLHYPRYDSDLGSLEEVARAVENGMTVVARGIGFGWHATTDTRTILVIAARFRVDAQPAADFSGSVQSVDLENRSFRLEDGTVIQLVEVTALDPNWWPTAPRLSASLEDVQEALDAGLGVSVTGHGQPVLDSDPPTIIATRVHFELALQDRAEFEGIVTAADVELGTVTIDDGTVVQIIGLTDVQPRWMYDARLLTIEAVARALEANVVVTARGYGELTDDGSGDEPRTVIAAVIQFTVGFTAIAKFEGEVSAIDVDAGIVQFASGTTVRLTDGTEIAFGDGLESLVMVREIVAGGEHTVVAVGAGAVAETEPFTLVALRILFALRQ